MAEIPTLTYAGDQALLVEFGDSIDIKINNKVRNLMVQLEQSQEDWIMDLVPSVVNPKESSLDTPCKI